MKKNDVFVETINMETQTVFHNNGSIDIYPCEFEMGQHIVSDGSMASQKGRMTTDNDGRSTFMPYAHNSGSRYTHLFATRHGEVKETQSCLIITFRFPKGYGQELIESLFKEEVEQMDAYIKTLDTTTEG